MNDAKTIAAYEAQSEDYARLIGGKHKDPALLRFIELVAPGGHVLDLGCGPATSSAVMRDRGFTVDPVDASSAMVSLANKTFDIGARLAGFHEIDAVASYDGVWANFSLLHATPDELPVHLTSLHRALKPDGLLHLGMKLGDGTARDRLGRFYAYYTEPALCALVTDAGFAVSETESGEARGLAGDIEPWLVVRAVRESAGTADSTNR